MENKERYIGLRLTGSLAEAIEAYCANEERTLSGAVRYLLTREMERLGYLTREGSGKTGGKKVVGGKGGRA